jgi:hypothetical protein
VTPFSALKLDYDSVIVDFTFRVADALLATVPAQA